MKRYGRRLVIFSFLIYILSFTGILAYEYFMFEGKRLLLSYRTPWVIDQALITLAELFIPLQITAVVLSYGLGPKKKESELPVLDPFHRIIRPALVFFIVITAVFTVLCEGIVPGSHTRQQELLYKTTVARNLLEKSASARSEGRYREAYDYLDEYLKLDPENEEYIQAQNELMDMIIKTREDAQPGRVAPAEEQDHIRPAMSAEEFIREARQFFDRGDYFSAHYYATVAYRTDPSRTDADRLAKQSWRMINKLEPSAQETEQYRLYQQKKQGFEALAAGQALEAYYLFTRLEKEYPLDPDITKYLEQSKKAVRTISFFRDELERTSRYPGTRHLVFLNSQDDTTREIVYIDTLKSIREGDYLFDIEVLAFTAQGTVLYHFTAPYGKIIQQRLVTLCIDRESDSDYYSADYITGSRPEAERDILPLTIPPGMMPHFSVEKGFLSRISLPVLWDLGKVYAEFGMRKEMVNIEITARLMKPFAFLLFSFLALAFCWAMRPDVRRPGFAAFILIPLVPAVTYYLLILYYYLARLFNGFLLVSLGFTPALVALVVVQGLFLTLVFLYLAGQSTE